MFPLMPSQEDEDDEDEDEEPPGEKAKGKNPEKERRAPPDLARHDVIKVKGKFSSHPVTWGVPHIEQEGHQVYLTLRDSWPPTCYHGCATSWRYPVQDPW